jgi:hypothetical protein
MRAAYHIADPLLAEAELEGAPTPWILLARRSRQPAGGSN